MKPLVDLSGKRGLIVGIANESSIAAGCAEAFAHCGARLAATYLNEKAKSHVVPRRRTARHRVDGTMRRAGSG